MNKYINTLINDQLATQIWRKSAKCILSPTKKKKEAVEELEEEEEEINLRWMKWDAMNFPSMEQI